MKRLGLLLLAFMVVVSGCTQSRTAQHIGGLRVVTSCFAVQDFAREILGDMGESTLLVPPGADTHSYEPSPKDMLSIQQADVFCYIGGENESWVQRVLSSVDTQGAALVKLIDCVTPIEEHHEHEGDHQDDHEDVDEHIWTSPKIAVLMVQAIGDALMQAAPQRKDALKANMDAYIEKLKRLDGEFEELVLAAPSKELVFGDRFPFAYFCRDYGLSAYAAFPSCANDTEPSAKTIAELIARVQRDNLPAVLAIEQSNQRVARAIAAQSDAKVLTLHSCHIVTQGEIDAGATYLSLMTANLGVLREALNYKEA